MDYWSTLAGKGVVLTEERAMERLNTARVNLKHRGLIPAHSQIEGFRSSVSTFLTAKAQSALAVEFDRLSLTHLLRSQTIKSKLDASEYLLKYGDHNSHSRDSSEQRLSTSTTACA